MLSEKGVYGKSPLNARSLELCRLDRATAIKIGHALTQRLDGLGSYGRYASYSLERAQADSDVSITMGQTVIFETRPADRNCAVSVERSSEGTYSLKADTRNDFEDNPELEGGKQLQLKLIETIESMEF